MSARQTIHHLADSETMAYTRLRRLAAEPEPVIQGYDLALPNVATWWLGGGDVRPVERMFVGDPPGRHDRLLDFSTPKTGTTFFAPSRRVLTGLCGG
mgnify:CR=1 FL=1